MKFNRLFPLKINCYHSFISYCKKCVLKTKVNGSREFVVKKDNIGENTSVSQTKLEFTEGWCMIDKTFLFENV